MPAVPTKVMPAWWSRGLSCSKHLALQPPNSDLGTALTPTNTQNIPGAQTPFQTPAEMPSGRHPVVLEPCRARSTDGSRGMDYLAVLRSFDMHSSGTDGGGPLLFPLPPSILHSYLTLHSFHSYGVHLFTKRHTHTQTHTHNKTPTYTHLHTCRHAGTHTYTHTDLQTSVQTHTHTHTHTYTHTYTDTHTHTHTH